jgi:hypothetical protein
MFAFRFHGLYEEGLAEYFPFLGEVQLFVTTFSTYAGTSWDNWTSGKRERARHVREKL